MKLSRKLIPAMIMLLVSAVLMSTASFAWFSTNSTATANGMKVTVASADNIMISTAANGSYVSTQAFTKNIDALVPASAVPGVSPAFFYMENAGANMVANSAAYQEGSEFTAAAVDQQYLTFDAYLKAVGETVDGASIVPEILITEGTNTSMVTKTDSPVYPALRVLIVYDDQAEGGTDVVLLYAPVADADTAYKPIKSVTEKTPVVGEDLTADDFATNGTSAIVTGLEAETSYKVSVYIWLEGQDENCTAANAISLAELSVTIGFKLVKAGS